MSLILVDSFDGYTSAEIPNYWTDLSAGGPASINTSQQRTGIGCMAPQPDGVRRYMGGQSAVIIAAAIKSTTTQATVIVFQKHIPFTSIFTVQTALVIQADGTLGIQLGLFGPIVASTDPKYPVQPGVYSYIEWKTGFNHGAQNEIRIEGQVVFSGVVDCQVTTDPGADNFVLHGVGGGDANYFDDFYLLRTDDALGLVDFVGDSMVFNRMPSSDGTALDWTPNPVVAHYLNVTEIPCDLDITRNTSPGSTKKDAYFVSPALNANDTIKAAQVVQAVRGDNQNTQTYLIVNGTVFQNTTNQFNAPGTYFPAHFAIFEHDPTLHDANPDNNVWTPANFNATQWGIQEV